jgi:hypothetical protein
MCRRVPLLALLHLGTVGVGVVLGGEASAVGGVERSVDVGDGVPVLVVAVVHALAVAVQVHHLTIAADADEVGASASLGVAGRRGVVLVGLGMTGAEGFHTDADGGQVLAHQGGRGGLPGEQVVVALGQEHLDGVHVGNHQRLHLVDNNHS